MDVDAINPVGRAHDEEDEEESVGDNQSLGDMPRERQLTQKFLAGQLSFKDLKRLAEELGVRRPVAPAVTVDTVQPRRQSTQPAAATGKKGRGNKQEKVSGRR